MVHHIKSVRRGEPVAEIRCQPESAALEAWAGLALGHFGLPPLTMRHHPIHAGYERMASMPRHVGLVAGDTIPRYATARQPQDPA